jgi:hypothetical protein
MGLGPSTSGIERASDVITGTISAIGPGKSVALRGSFNVLFWNQTTDALTTTNASSSATIASASNVAAGQTIKSVNVPAGTTVATIAGTAITLAFPPGFTNANVVTGTDNAAVFINGTYTATIQIERSFDGGATWQICGIGGGGQQAIYTNLGTVSVVAGEPEEGVLYRLNCPAYTSGTILYRISTTGYATGTFGLL